MTRIACIASMPSRKNLLLRTAESLRGQVDEVLVYLNGYDAAPFSLEPVSFYRSERCGGDRGACGKFFPVHAVKPRGYVFICDDDLLYADGYCDTLIEGVERYGRRAAVTLHGKTFALPVESYYRSKKQQTKHHCMTRLARDEPTAVAGTGVLCFHTDTLRLSEKDFPDRLPNDVLANAADLRFSDACHRRGVPLVCLKHTGSEVEHQKIDYRKTIHSIYYNTDAVQTEFLNTRPHGWPVAPLETLTNTGEAA